jgi:hypothetical protein
MKNKTIEFSLLDEKGELLQVVAKRPTTEQARELQLVYNSAMAKALQKEDILLEAQVSDLAEKRGLWSDEKKEKDKELDKKIIDLTMKLLKGGKVSEGRKIALEIIKCKNEQRALKFGLNSLSGLTAESVATTERLNHAVVMCLVYKNSNNPCFVDVNDYLDRADEKLAMEGAKWVAYLLYDLDPDYEKKLPEYQFLLKYKFVNDKLQFIDKQGRLVDESGRLVRDDGRFVNEDGELVNIYGQRVDEDANVLVEFGQYTED